MCGLVMKFNFDKDKPVNNDILQQYDKQSSRGKRGFGLFDGQYMHIVREANEDNILKWLVEKDSNLILFHHRLPTSTINVARAAHPFSTKKYFGKTEYILAHNGIICNAEELWVAHQALGIRYTSLLEDLSFNDSEALMWDLALTLEGKQKDMKAYGGMAFIMMKKVDGKLTDMLYGRNSRPLNVRHTEDSIEMSSEGPGESILPNYLYDFNFKTKAAIMARMEFPASDPSWVPYTQPKQAELLPAHATHDAYDSYDEWHKANYGVKYREVDKESNWERLRAKYGKAEKLSGFSGASLRSIGDILDAKKDESGKFIVETEHSDMSINLDDVDIKDYAPSTAQVQNCAMEYMIEAQGNFEAAYYLLEQDYADYMEACDGQETFEDLHQQLQFEAALRFIEGDPEYHDGQSTSSVWLAMGDSGQLAMA